MNRNSQKPLSGGAFACGTLATTFLAAAWLTTLSGCGGCSDSSTPIGGGGLSQTELVGQYEGELLANAVDNLNRLEEYDSGTILPQIVNRLNQWAQSQEMPADWTHDPLLETLPDWAAELPNVKDLDKARFTRYDGPALQEAVWMRDLARWVVGEETDDVERAKRLFDWTVRNIQLKPEVLTTADGSDVLLRRLPWETLLLGQGTPLDRAWVFILTARQLGLDVALLAVSHSPDGDEAGDEKTENGASRAWVAALHSDGQYYLFEPVLGLPIPAPDGIRLDEDGRLDIRPATLAEAASDPSVLDRLAINDEDRYPVRAEDLKDIEVLIEASPSYLAQRMKLLESRLAGKKKVVLTTDASTQAQRWLASPRIARASLWTVPYAAIHQQSAADPQLQSRLLQYRVAALAPFKMVADSVLWKGRVRHLKGNLTGEKSATYYYQSARAAGQALREAERSILTRTYQTLKKQNAQQDPAKQMTEQQLQTAARQEAAAELTMLHRANQHASFWLGVIQYERGTDSSRRSAIDYFTKWTLDAWPDGPWTHAAKYNLARTYEAAGQPEEAITRYQLDTTSISYLGNLLRARWLRSLQSDADTTEPGTTEPGTTVEEPNVTAPEPTMETPEPTIEIPEPAVETPEPSDVSYEQ